MSPNRIVAALTPLVFAPLAGAVSAWVAKNAPGVDVPSSSLQEIFIAGALIALAPAAQWLRGWQKYETRQAEDQQALALANASPPEAAAGDQQQGPAGLDGPELEEDFDDLEAGGDLGEGGEFDELDGLDELDELDGSDELDEFEELEEIEEAPVATEEEPTRTGG